MSRPPDPDIARAPAAVQGGGNTLEYPAATSEIVEALHVDRQALVRDAILWQRWIRYVGFVALVALALAFGRERARMLLPVTSVALAYVLCVSITAAIVRRAATVHEHRIPALLVTADILTLTAISG